MKILTYDIGGTYIKYGVISNTYEIDTQAKTKTPHDSIESFTQVVRDIYQKYGFNCDGIAISMPGRVDSNTGVLNVTGKLSYLDDCNMFDLFHQFMDKSITVENDGKCAALAEKELGSLKDVETGVVLVFGTGLGGGLIINHRLHKGFNLMAGEFSLILNQTEDKVKIWAQKGSIPALIRQVETALGVPKNSLTGEDIFSYIANNDSTTIKVFETYCKEIAIELYNLQYIIDPECIAIGGGVSANPLFIQYLNKAVDDLYTDLLVKVNKPTLILTKYRNDSNLLGAVVHYLKSTRELL